MTPAEQAAREVFTGWMTYRDSLVDRIAAAIEQARREEREACAKIAETWVDGVLYHRLSTLIPDFPCHEHVKIAAVIRARAQGGT